MPNIDNTRIPFKNAVISSNDVPASGTAGGNYRDPVRDGGLNAVNLWGTGAGFGVPAGYAMLGLDGVYVWSVTVAADVKENEPVYITSANALTTTSTGNTLFGYTDEPATAGTRTIGVRVSNAIGA